MQSKLWQKIDSEAGKPGAAEKFMGKGRERQGRKQPDWEKTEITLISVPDCPITHSVPPQITDTTSRREVEA